MPFGDTSTGIARPRPSGLGRAQIGATADGTRLSNITIVVPWRGARWDVIALMPWTCFGSRLSRTAGIEHLLEVAGNGAMDHFTVPQPRGHRIHGNA
jgi:hypothetical protein